MSREPIKGKLTPEQHTAAMPVIADWIRSERRQLGLRREDIEALCGVSVSTVHRIERGSESVAVGSVRAVVEALGGTLEVRYAGNGGR